jgi:hypothetical protein
MRHPILRRLIWSTAFALLAGAAVALGNPMDHVKADFRADAHGLKMSLEVAGRAIENCITRA